MINTENIKEALNMALEYPENDPFLPENEDHPYFKVKKAIKIALDEITGINESELSMSI